MNDADRRKWDDMAAAVRGAAPAATLAVYARAARQVAEWLDRGELPAGVEPLRVGVLRSFTAELLAPPLVACLAEAGFAARVRLGELGAIAPEILSPDSFVYRDDIDVCIVAALAEHVLGAALDPAGAGGDSSAAEYLAQLERLAMNFKGVVIACNLAWPVHSVAPMLQAQQTASGRYAVGRFNERLAGFTERHANLVVCDIEGLALHLGGTLWSPRDMATAMQPFSPAGLAAVARRLAEACVLAKRAPVKCLVLDCDNTLWGGIVGEDGLAGIQLGETYPGWCFQVFQKQLDQLNRLGFLLALNSKNNEADVRAAFEQHRGMALRLDQIAALRVNWRDKVANMRELAEELNLGLESFVFIDDNDFELTLVREQLPRVRCLKVPAQPWLLPELLPRAGLIDRLRVTAEDRVKTRMYVEERRREEFRAAATDLEGYLRGLEIELTFEAFEAGRHLARAAQLTQKTNQFNLTTRRFSEAELLAAVQGGARAFLGGLRDRFGEYGRIAMALVTPSGDPQTCELTLFLMSCRALGRGVEESFVRLVMGRMRAAGFARMTACFIPTARNGVCEDFLGRAKFVESGRDADGRVNYEYDLRSGPLAPAAWLKVMEQEPADG